MAAHPSSALVRSLVDNPAEASNWTVIGRETVVVGGSCSDVADFERLVARATRLAGDRRVSVEATCEPDLDGEHAALLLGTPILFEAGSAVLQADSAAALDFLAAVAWQFDEALAWAEGDGDALRFDAEAVDLARRRAAALVAYLDYRGVRRVETRTQARRRNVAVLRPAERRVELRIT